MSNKSLSTFLTEWGGQVKALIENSGSAEPKEKKVPTVKVESIVVTPSDNIGIVNGDGSFYTDSDGQIVAGGDVYFFKNPSYGGTWTSIYMKDLKDNEDWCIACYGAGSFRILETDNYAEIYFPNVYYVEYDD